MTEELVYLGKAKTVTEKFAVIEPVLFSDRSRKRWDGNIPPHQRRITFPDKGDVFWFKPHPTIQVGSYWEFEIQKHPDYQRKSGYREKYQVRIHPEPRFREAVEIIDLRHSGTIRDISEGLTSKEGFPLGVTPVMRIAMLWIRDDLWLGPVRTFRCSDSTRWRIECGKGDDDFSAIDASVPDLENVRLVQCEGTRYVVPPGGDFGRKIEPLNWETDEQLARRLLKRIGRLDPEPLKALELTKKVFDTYITILSRKETDLLGADLEQELARKERIAELKGFVERNIPIVEEAVRIFCSSDHFRKRLEQIEEEVREATRSEVERKVEDELKGKRKEIETIGTRIQEKKADLSAMEKRLRKRKEDLEKKFGPYEVEFSKRLSAMAEKPEMLFPDLAIFRHALSPHGGEAGEGSLPLCLVGDDSETQAVVPETVVNKEQFLLSMGRLFHEHGFSPFLANRLLSGFLSGLVPVVAGDRAYESVQLFSRCVSGGRILWIPVSGSLYEPHDLFGTTDRSGRYVPHPAGLLEAIRNAHRSPEALFLVVLDGFNRASIDSYLFPLLQCRSDCIVGGRTMYLPLDSCLVTNGDIRSVRSTRLMWPNNLLLALIPSDSGSFKPSRRFWQYVLLLDSEQGPIFAEDGELRHPDEKQIEGGIAEVPRSIWDPWIDEARSKSLTDSEPWLSDAQKAVGTRIREESLRFFTACLVAGMEIPDAKKQVQLSCILPRIADIDTDAADILRKLGLNADKDADGAIALLRQLGG